MKTFKNQEKCFNSDPILDWEPVQMLEGGGGGSFFNLFKVFVCTCCLHLCKCVSGGVYLFGNMPMSAKPFVLGEALA